jgi:hypothetical protein
VDYEIKKGPKTPHNKTIGDVASNVVEIVYRHPELYAPEILEDDVQKNDGAQQFKHTKRC